MGVRTKKVLDKVLAQLGEKGRTAEDSTLVATEALAQLNLAVSDDKTEYLLYLSQAAIQQFSDACDEHWTALSEAAAKRGDGKKKGKSTLGKDVVSDLKVLLDGRRAADLAMFGRMLADIPSVNIDAACQMAHAISVNEAAMEMDFYTAVDDLAPAEETGAGMMGVVEFNSSCFYRYATIDWRQLVANLGGDVELARAALGAFTQGFTMAIPSGKQNSMAAHNPPSYIRVHVRDSGAPWNLANAFLSPVRPGQRDDAGLDARAEQRLEEYFERLVSVYGDDGFRGDPLVVSLRTTSGMSLADLTSTLVGMVG